MIAEGEHQQQDFKTRIDDSRKIARTLVAFANADGGRLLIGVKDNGTVSGVRVDEELHMVEAAAEPRRWSPPICWLGIFYILFMIGLLCFTYYQFTLPWPEGHPQRNPDGSWKIRVDGREL